MADSRRDALGFRLLLKVGALRRSSGRHDMLDNDILDVLGMQANADEIVDYRTLLVRFTTLHRTLELHQPILPCCVSST